MLFKTDLNVDPLTGMSNLFSLLESRTTDTFGPAGVVVAADIANFHRINSDFGREIGDRCVCVVAEMLLSKVEEWAGEFENATATAFRLGGDEFILVLPDRNYADGEKLGREFKTVFAQKLSQYGVKDAGLHIAVVSYTKKEALASILLKSIYLALEDSRRTAEVPSVLPGWAEHIIDIMVRRVCDTVELLREASAIALTDEISGLPNHRAATILLDELIGKYSAVKEKFCILFIDGDNLKQYNNLGYQRGNRMIRDLAEVIKANIRQEDTVARWLSGDEFIVLLPDTEQDAAMHVAERLRTAVEHTSAGWPFPITISIGIACYPENGIRAEELMVKAEEANAMAKREGKNRIISFI